ncbi:MobF family relaxase [Sphingorhabdus sp. EL138]|uniref:MobF family relaxase n=1 Tax=Sphingorhabdus sp. EL138 TaxID=2073156 RepID=UPI000D6986B5|nr:MobF family relaxase [Sphingorhabdus sp. EL138]
MLSASNVRSAGGAANYFAADNYYTKSDADRSGQWIGDGAERLGLRGQVEAPAFEALLRGELPNGERVGSDKQYHRAGTDLTFSLPKSWSLLALVGGDKRIIDAYRTAVTETLQWAEKNIAETRVFSGGKIKAVGTGNLAIGLFQHDTNRNQEPNVHFHAVVANVTQGPDAKWRALHNDKLWSNNTLLNSIAMARFRLEIEKLGYAPGRQGKHGNFEAAGISREAVMAFSTRRQEVLDARRGPGMEAGKIAALATRAPKEAIKDRDALSATWREAAQAMELDLGGLIEKANIRAAGLELDQNPNLSLAQKGMIFLRAFAERLHGYTAKPASDPLVQAHILNKPREEIAAAQAAASAIRHLAQREAAFGIHDIYKTALDFGLPTSIAHVERRVRALVREGELVRGKGRDRDFLTTRDALQIEQRIIGQVEAGRGKTEPVLSSQMAGEQLQAVAGLNFGMTLNKGQESAGRMILSSSNRTLAVQGIAGAGKSSLLKPVSQLLGENGKTVLGLAVQNTLVQMLERDTGIASMTLARFIGNHKKILEEGASKKDILEAKAAMKNHVLVLDEASMVSNVEKEKLVRLANLLEVDRLVMIGDKKQLGAVDAGKPFALVQSAGIDTAKMITNLRARDKTLRRAQYSAQAGNIGEAMSYLKDHIVETKEGSALIAAERWLALAPEERQSTAIYASGRALRTAVNEAVQSGLRANNELGKRELKLQTYSRVNSTREELRYVHSYKPGMMIELKTADRAQRLGKGQYDVVSVNERTKQLVLKDRKGRERSFQVGKLRANAAEDQIALYEKKQLGIFAGDKIRWTDSDHKRGLFNADQANITAIDDKHVNLQSSSGVEHRLRHDDPMLKRVDLAYALNAHMAQGLTSDRGIAVMDSRERNLSNKQTFLVTITRLRDGLTLIVDNREKLEAVVEKNDGVKTSALEVTARLGKAAATGLAKGQDIASTEPQKNQRELEKEHSKPLDMGI